MSQNVEPSFGWAQPGSKLFWYECQVLCLMGDSDAGTRVWAGGPGDLLLTLEQTQDLGHVLVRLAVLGVLLCWALPWLPTPVSFFAEDLEVAVDAPPCECSPCGKTATALLCLAGRGHPSQPVSPSCPRRRWPNICPCWAQAVGSWWAA